MSISAVNDTAASLGSAFAVIIEDVVAGGGADGTEVDGPSVDRTVIEGAPKSPFLGGAILVTAEAVLGAGETLTVDVQIQDSPNASVWTDYATLSAVLVLTSVGGSTERGTGLVTIQDPTTKKVLQGADKFLRAQVTPTMSAGATDTADLTASFVFSGGAVAP